jgi:hypothetical protein
MVVRPFRLAGLVAVFIGAAVVLTLGGARFRVVNVRALEQVLVKVQIIFSNC